MDGTAIRTYLTDFLDVLEARTPVVVWDYADGKENLVKDCWVYDLLADKEFIQKYGFYKLAGMNVALGRMSILIKQERTIF